MSITTLIKLLCKVSYTQTYLKNWCFISKLENGIFWDILQYRASIANYVVAMPLLCAGEYICELVYINICNNNKAFTRCSRSNLY